MPALSTRPSTPAVRRCAWPGKLMSTPRCVLEDRATFTLNWLDATESMFTTADSPDPVEPVSEIVSHHGRHETRLAR
jgi:hypothetical protein